jgi:hypothetical protein
MMMIVTMELFVLFLLFERGRRDTNTREKRTTS